MAMVSPVMYAAPSDARNATSSATSSGSPKRPSEIPFLSSSSLSSLVMSVLMKPGAMAFTVMFLMPTSFDRAFVAAIIAPLAAE